MHGRRSDFHHCDQNSTSSAATRDIESLVLEHNSKEFTEWKLKHLPSQVLLSCPSLSVFLAWAPATSSGVARPYLVFLRAAPKLTAPWVCGVSGCPASCSFLPAF